MITICHFLYIWADGGNINFRVFFSDDTFLMSPPVIVLIVGCVVVILLSVASILMSASPCRGATSSTIDKNVWLGDLRGLHGGRLSLRGIGHPNGAYAVETQPVPMSSRWEQPLRTSIHPVNVDMPYVPAGPKYTGGFYNATRGRAWSSRLPRYVLSASDAYSYRRDDQHGSTETLNRV